MQKHARSKCDMTASLPTYESYEENLSWNNDPYSTGVLGCVILS